MTQELIDAQTGEIVVPALDVSIARKPAIVLAEAHEAARALQDVISKKAKPVKFNGEQYLEFEDWLTVGKFYGLTVKVESTNLVDYGEVRGFEARAVVLDIKTGRIVSAADSMCLNDEEKWSKRAKYEWKTVGGQRIKEKVGEESVPLFQLRSMAQTRACAKALRNVLAWVVVLAGYKPTPAEEMDGVHTREEKHDNPDVRKMKSRFPGECAICGDPIAKDEDIAYRASNKSAAHWACYETKAKEEAAGGQEPPDAA